MSPRTETMYFVLREGATQEEQWERRDIEAMCESGELTPGARIFMPEKGAWVPLSETDLAERLPRGAGDGDAGDPVREALELDYEATVERLRDQPGALDLLVEAGVLAHELGETAAAREYFQEALDVHPYNGRVAQEVKRRFSRSECRSFRSLERPGPAWDDLGEMLSFAFSRGPLYYVVPAAVLALAGILPFGLLPGAVLTLLWTTVITRAVARGSTATASWREYAANPVRDLLVPAAAIVTVCVELGVILFAVAKGAMMLEGESAKGIFEYVTGSPIMIVVTALVALAYVPASAVVAAGRQPLVAAAPWKVVASAMRMEQEYIISVLFIAAVAFVCGGLYVAAARVPVLGEVLTAAAIAVMAPSVGLMLGRLRARHEHVLLR